jgi:hypothetical protein
MYYNRVLPFCQLIVSKDPILIVVIAEEYFGAVCAAFYLEDSLIAELSAVGNAQELTSCEVRTLVACQLCGFG